jgi:hypothetical protein
VFWRKKRKPKEPPSDSAADAQIWTREPSALDALSGRLPDPERVGDQDKSDVYPDEIDPEWADPDTAE